MKRKLDDDTMALNDADRDTGDASDEDADHHEISADQSNSRRKCPYLDTVNRQALDFDSEKLCSITLTNMNVYVCLVCGKYFQGRGKATPAYTHSVQAGHFVFMNLSSARTFCLPDGYEVFDPSLQDAQKCLSPSYTLQEVAELNSNTSLARDVHGVSYLPGFVGLNNLNCTDYINSLLHALAHVTPFRDFWLQSGHYEMSRSGLVQHFGLTLRKMWSSNNFKSTVSPHELVQALSVESQRRFGPGQRAECLDLLVWLLGSLQRGLGKAAWAHSTAATPMRVRSAAKARSAASAQSSSVLYEPFQGVVEVTTLTKRLVSSAEELQKGTEGAEGEAEGEWVRTVAQVPFTHLSVDLPPCPLFRDSEGGLIIPQIPLFQLLQKFDGETWTDSVTSEAHVRRQYRLLRLPRYLILHLVRFTRNNFYLEKNPTIVTFPVKNLELRDFLVDEGKSNADAHEERETNNGAKKSGLSLGAERAQQEERMLSSCPTTQELQGMSAAQLKQLVLRLGSELHHMELSHVMGETSCGAAVEVTARQRADLLTLARTVVERVSLFAATKYDLLANICHSSDATSSSTKGGVTVGDLNMMLGQAGAAAMQKSKARNAAAAGSGSVGSVNAGTGASVESVRGNAAYTASSTAAANNRVLNDGAFRVHLQHKATGQWFEIQDLHVNEVTPQLIGVSESNILIYEKKPTATVTK